MRSTSAFIKRYKHKCKIYDHYSFPCQETPGAACALWIAPPEHSSQQIKERLCYKKEDLFRLCEGCLKISSELPLITRTNCLLYYLL